MSETAVVSLPAAKPPIPSFIPTWLSDNPMFTAGFGLFGVGAAMAILRTGAGISAQIAKRRFLATLEIPSRDYSYQWVMQWLISKNGNNARHLGVETCYTKDSAGNARTSFDYIPSPGRHWMNHKGVILVVDRDRQQSAMDSTVGTPFETLTLTTAAWHRSIFDEILREARDRALAKEEGRTVVYHASGHDWRPFGPPKRIRPIESVILADGVAESLIADVDDFRRRGDWYAERGIPYRRGYLLHGPPGTGKSSFTLALAGRLRVGVAALNVGDPTLTDERCGRPRAAPRAHARHASECCASRGFGGAGRGVAVPRVLATAAATSRRTDARPDRRPPSAGCTRCSRRRRRTPSCSSRTSTAPSRPTRPRRPRPTPAPRRRSRRRRRQRAGTGGCPSRACSTRSTASRPARSASSS